MTTYELPREPDVDRVWVNFPEGWHVARRITHNVWSVGMPDNVEHSWAELLDLGGVSDQHPDLPERSPLPWTVDKWGHVADADGHMVCEGDGAGLAAFIVAAVNAYADRLTDEAES